VSDLERRTGSRLSRRDRERRAFRLVLATGTLGTLAVVSLVLAVLGVVSGAWPLVLGLLAGASGFALRRTL
jgi:CHASE2 domain-containing sensor protein